MKKSTINKKYEFLSWAFIEAHLYTYIYEYEHLHKLDENYENYDFDGNLTKEIFEFWGNQQDFGEKKYTYQKEESKILSHLYLMHLQSWLFWIYHIIS